MDNLCTIMDSKWIGTPVSDKPLFANTAAECQKFCQDTQLLPPGLRCCFYNWNYVNGDCNLFSQFQTIIRDSVGFLTGFLPPCGDPLPSCLNDRVQCTTKQNQKTQNSTRAKKQFESFIKKYLISKP